MKFSILITYFNEGEWLTECVNSILPQLEPGDEIVVYDDASQLPAGRFLPTDSRIRCIRGDSNVGPARGRNRLIAESSGDVLHFHDADDLFGERWYKQVAGAFRNDVDAVFTDVQSFDAHGGVWRRIMDISRLEKDGDLIAAACRGMLVPSGSYRRSLIESAGGYGASHHSEDYGFHLRIALAAPRFVVIDDDMICIRRHKGQRSLNRSGVWSNAVEILESLADRFPQSHHRDLARAATRAGSTLFAVGEPAAARRAFKLAQRYGGPLYDRPLMNLLTRGVGAMGAEMLAARYRTLMPHSLRARLQKAGI